MSDARLLPGAHAMECWSSSGRTYSGISLPVRVRYEIDWHVPDDEEPIVTFFYSDRLLTASRVDARELGRGTLKRQLADQVRIMVHVDSFTESVLAGRMYALPVARPGEAADVETGMPATRPVTIPLLGPVEYVPPRRYGPAEGERAAIDAVLHCLYGPSDVAAERLLADVNGSAPS